MPVGRATLLSTKNCCRIRNFETGSATKTAVASVAGTLGNNAAGCEIVGERIVHPFNNFMAQRIGIGNRRMWIIETGAIKVWSAFPL